MEYNSPKFRKWLDQLQQESWQLELIISGFAIYGLVSAIDIIETKAAIASISEIYGLALAWAGGYICILIFIFNLILHVLLRGLWIGAIGLRYVSGDIDYEKLNYSDRFTSYLKHKVGSFDSYISKLENYCSILFSITFLLVFYVLGFMAVITIMGLTINLTRSLTFIPDDISFILRIVIGVVFGVCASIVFIDFLGQGFLKKKKWTTKLYFPIYWVFSKLTLSFLYRPIAYNFLDNKLGKRVSLFLLPVYLAIFLGTSFDYYNSNHLVFLKESSKNFADNLNYDDEITEKTEFVDFASIPSKIIHTPYLRVFIPFSSAKENFVYDINKGLMPENDIRGFGSDIMLGYNNTDLDKPTKNKNLSDYLLAINQLYSLKVDSTPFISDFIITKNAKKRIGFQSYLNVRNLPEGKHLLTITGPMQKTKNNEKETEITTLATIPFWYFPENPAPQPVVPKTTEEQAAAALETPTPKTN